jgi:hypothetical protein
MGVEKCRKKGSTLHLGARTGYVNFLVTISGLGEEGSHKDAEKCPMPENLPPPALHISLKKNC